MYDAKQNSSYRRPPPSLPPLPSPSPPIVSLFLHIIVSLALLTYLPRVYKY